MLARTMDGALAAALRIVGADPGRHSWHSYRIRLACRLRAAHKDDHTIQACCRWKTVQSLDTYARFEPDYYWQLLMDADAQDATSEAFRSQTFPEFDEAARLRALQNASTADEGQQSDEDQAGPAELIPQPGARPVPPPQRTLLQSSAVHRQAEPERPRGRGKGYPPGYQLLPRTKANGSAYKSYVAPDGTEFGPNRDRAWAYYHKHSDVNCLTVPSPQVGPNGAQGASSEAALAAAPPPLAIPSPRVSTHVARDTPVGAALAVTIPPAPTPT